MGDTRFSHGLAFGKVNSFNFDGAVSGTAGLITESDTTPDVTNGNLFYTNNTSTTVITYFDLLSPQGANTQPGLFEGKKITIVFLDDSTSLARSSQMVIAGSGGNSGANHITELLFHNSAWVETNRSSNTNDVLSLDAGITGSTGILNVQGRRLVITNAIAGSANIIRRAINGEQGQRLTIVNAGSSTTIIVNSGGAATDTFISSSSASTLSTLVMANSSAIEFIRVGSRWWETRPLVTGSVNWLL